MIQTSYFANHKALYKSGLPLISIARKMPSGFNATPFPELAPSQELLESFKNGEIGVKDYEKTYRTETLSKVDRSLVKRRLNGAVLLCWESPEKFCHRKIVRKWLAEENIFSVEFHELLKVAVIGSRTFNDYSLLQKTINRILLTLGKNQKLVIVSGGASGADSLAEQFASENLIEIKIFPAQWDLHGKSAGFIRNRVIWENSDFGIAFWDGSSKGTAHSFKLAEKMGKPLVIFNEKKRSFEVQSNIRLNEPSLF